MRILVCDRKASSEKVALQVVRDGRTLVLGEERPQPPSWGNGVFAQIIQLLVLIIPAHDKQQRAPSTRAVIRAIPA